MKIKDADWTMADYRNGMRQALEHYKIQYGSVLLKSIQIYCGEGNQFGTRFYKQTSCYVMSRVNMINRLYQLRDQEIKLIRSYCGMGVTGYTERVLRIDKNQSEVYDDYGWGWKEPGKWPLGEYTVTVYLRPTDGLEWLGEEKFQIV